LEREGVSRAAFQLIHPGIAVPARVLYSVERQAFTDRVVELGFFVSLD